MLKHKVYSIRNKLRYSLFIRKVLKLFFHFDNWHVISINDRKYVTDIINFIEHDNSIKTIAEIGCGLGDIIGSINDKECIGCDISSEVIKAAKILSPKTSFLVGSFDNIKYKKIDCLITVNFMHSIEPEQLKKYYKKFFKNNKVEYVIFDSVKSRKYQYNHTASEILGNNWIKELTIGKYSADRGIRYIELFKKQV